MIDPYRDYVRAVLQRHRQAHQLMVSCTASDAHERLRLELDGLPEDLYAALPAPPRAPEAPEHRIEVLARRFGLTRLDTTTLAVAWVDALDASPSSQLSALHGLDGLCILGLQRLFDTESTHAITMALQDESPLLAEGLLMVAASERPRPLLGVRLAPPLLAWLNGGALTLPRGLITLVAPGPEDARAAQPARGGEPRRQLLTGGTPALREHTARDAAEGRTLLGLRHDANARAVRLAARLLDAILLAPIPEDGPSPTLSDLWSMPELDIVLSASHPAHSAGLDRVPTAQPVRLPDLQERTAAWEKALRHNPSLDPALPASRFPALHCDAAMKIGASLVPGSSTGDLLAACRAQHNPAAPGLSRIEVSPYQLHDLVLPTSTQRQLHALTSQLRWRAHAQARWHARHLLPRGSGLRLMFRGPPGTGKSMAAGALSNALGYTLVRADLSAITSKWIGETEKHLGAVFDAAEDAGALLLFDEGDALFQSRGTSSEPGAAHQQRQVAYLLQRLEAHRGAVVVTTNLGDAIDPALLRRFDAVLRFPAPGPVERRRLWDASLPPERCSTLDLDALSRFELTGAHIAAATLHAAASALSEDQPIHQAHVLTAIAAQLRKAGQQLRRADFGAAWPAVQLAV